MSYPALAALLATLAATTVWGFAATGAPPGTAPGPPSAAPVAVETPRPGAGASPKLTGDGPQLRMVLIRTSAAAVAQLRKLPIDIIRIRPVGESRPPRTKTDFLQSQVIVEAVAPASLLAKLKERGFELIEAP